MENSPVKSQADRHELAAIKARYDRRKGIARDLYNPISAYNMMVSRDRYVTLCELIRKSGLVPLADKKLLEIGCGSGTNLLEFMRLGFRPENIVANELLEDRAAEARHNLPQAIRVNVGDASEMDWAPETFDVVFQSTVFTSILDDAFQEKLANRMWSWVRPGGGVLWFDYIYNNPWNPDVKGVPVRRIRQLFPHGKMKMWRVTLAPPIGRAVTKISRHLYTVFNLFPVLRTHVLCWIRK